VAYETGTAADYADLRAKLIAFLTTNADLVAANQQWQVAWTGSGRMPDAEEDIVLKGPGLAVTEEILIALRSDPQPVGDRYNYGFRGIVGVNPVASNWDEHTNASDPVYLCCGDFEMPYWFIANGRRFIVIARVSATYQLAYAGLFLAYAPPNVYPYPMVVGGCTSVSTSRWSDTGDAIHFFCDPGIDANLKVFRYDNVWIGFQNWTESNGWRDGDTRVVGPWNPGWTTKNMPLDTFTNNRSYRLNFFNKMQPAYGGDYPLTPASLIHHAEPKSILGVLQGVYHIPGFNLSAETIITQGTTEYLCIPDVYREANESFCAIELNGD